LPLLYGVDAIEPHVATGRRIFMPVYSDVRERFLSTAAERGWRVELIRLPLPGSGSVLVVNP
jgi:hypothetical protein